VACNVRRGHRCRKHRSRCDTAKRSVLGDYKPLTLRPRKADYRSEAGYWEGDLVIGTKNASAVARRVERVSRHTLIVALPAGYSANNVAAAVNAALR